MGRKTGDRGARHRRRPDRRARLAGTPETPAREDVIPELEPFCSEFLSTFVDNEGTMKGTDLRLVSEAAARRPGLPITAAGGIRSMREVRALEKIGMHAAVGMAIYTGQLAANKTGSGKSYRERNPRNSPPKSSLGSLR